MDPVSAIANALGAIVPGLGIGSKSRIKEITAATDANIKLAEVTAENDAEQTKNTTKIVVVAGVILLVLVIIFLTLRKK